MKLLELRYQKLPIVDKIMSIVDDLSVGGSSDTVNIFQKYGIDPFIDPERVRRDITVMDEFKIMQLYRALVGGK